MPPPAGSRELLDARTALCAVIGDPVGHSLSPEIHNAAFQATGLNFAYLAFRVEDLAGAIQGVRALGIRGVSVTLPHKVAVIEHLDEVEPVARRIGSVNTIVNANGRLLGSTTDGLGALEALRAAGADPAGRRIVVLGAGGSARAIAMTLALEAAPSHLTILARDPSRAARLGTEVANVSATAVSSGSLDETSIRNALASPGILIHTTSVGMTSGLDGCLVPERWLHRDLAVFDIVYTPLVTELARRAAAAGARVVPGVEMFVHQAAAQFRAWTGIPAPVDVMRRAALARLTP